MAELRNTRRWELDDGSAKVGSSVGTTRASRARHMSRLPAATWRTTTPARGHRDTRSRHATSPKRAFRTLPVFLLYGGLALGCAGDSQEQKQGVVRTPTTVVSAPEPSFVPPGVALPTDATCAERVVSTPEVRSQNSTANSTVLQVALPVHPDFDETWQQQYRTRITGAFEGTTDEIIQWAACKWGLDVDLLRAQAWEESKWLSSAEGDYVPASSGRCVPGDRRDPCPTSFGILQNKWFYNPGSYPATVRSTAWSLDFSAAALRGCYDGHKHIDGELRGGGDMWGCLGNWFSGSWYDRGANGYVARLRRALNERGWPQP